MRVGSLSGFIERFQSSPEELQSAIEITLQRFSEFDSLQGAFGRRAVIEQAKGILMERHKIEENRAFDMIRSHSQTPDAS